MKLEIELDIPYAAAGAMSPQQSARLTCYLLPETDRIPDQREKPLVLVCPGGGYAYRSEREAEPIAMQFLAAGMHAAILHYSVAPNRYPTAALELAYAGIRSATTDATPVSGGGNTREDSMLSNIVHRDELKRRLKEAKLWVSVVDRALEVLDDEEWLVLDRFYIHRTKGAVSELCDRLNLEKSAVYDRRDKALRHFTLALYGVTETE